MAPEYEGGRPLHEAIMPKLSYIRIIRSRRSISGFDPLDFGLMAVLTCLGLVWCRIFFIFAVVTSTCAEQIAALAYVESGWLSGQTVWSLLFGVSIIAGLHALTVTILYSGSVKWSVVTFRITTVCGFLMMSLLFRALIVEGIQPPDGIVFINTGPSQLNTGPNSTPNSIKYDSGGDSKPVELSVCVFVARKTIVIPDSKLNITDRNLENHPISVFEKGVLIKRLQQHQTYLDLSENDIADLVREMHIDRNKSGPITAHTPIE